jgi:uncharacterized protein (TIGR00730 family)
MIKLAVFCGSSLGVDAGFAAEARNLGEALVKMRVTLVYGGACAGIMGVLAETVLAGRGQVTGVMPRFRIEAGLSHPQLTELRVVEDMRERKAVIVDLADAFAVLPGGFGTAEELFETLALAQMNLHRKPIGLLNLMGYFEPLLQWMDAAVTSGFLTAHDRSLIRVAADSTELLSALMR